MSKLPEQWIKGCAHCPFAELRLGAVHWLCILRTEPPRVGEFPHFTTEQTERLNKGELFAPEWCALRSGVTFRLAPVETNALPQLDAPTPPR